MLKDPPEDQLLDSLSALLRAGLPPALDGTEWTDDECPAGHWLMPEGSRLYRYDVPAQLVMPCAIFFFDKDSTPYDPVALGGDELWWLNAAVDLIWDRDLTTLETQQLVRSLRAVFLTDRAGTVPSGQQSVTARLSTAAAVGTPGIQVLRLRNPLLTVQKSTAGHPEFNLTFTALCAGIPPLTA